MLSQNNKVLNKNIRDSGCYFLSLLAIPQIELKKGLAATNINSIYDQAIENKYMDLNCNIKDPDGILKIAFKYLASNKKFLQVGVLDMKTMQRTFWGWVKTTDWDWIIVEYKTDTSFGTHFALRDKDNVEFYDPLAPEDYKPIGITKLVYYRNFS